MNLHKPKTNLPTTLGMTLVILVGVLVTTYTYLEAKQILNFDSINTVILEAGEFRDRDDNTYFVNPSAPVSANFAGDVGIGIGTLNPGSKLDVVAIRAIS